MTESTDIQAAMANLRRSIERRIAAAEKVERASRSPHKGPLAAYDTAALGKRLRPKIERDGRGWRAVAADIGVTAPDLSRIMAGQSISAAKVFAVCDWAGIDPRRFYRPARGKKCFTGKALKQGRGKP